MPELLEQGDEGGEDNGRDDEALYPSSELLPSLGVDRKPLEDLEHGGSVPYQLTQLIF